MATAIHLAKTRDSLTPRGEPYWGAPLTGGVYLGYRKHKNGTGTWVARWRDESCKQRQEKLGRASAKFDHGAAQAAALAWLKRVEAGIEDSDVESVEDACRAYVADLNLKDRKRTAHATEVRFRRRIYGTPFGQIKLAKLRTAQIEQWRAEQRGRPLRGGKAELTPASLNRLLTILKAALNLAVRSRAVPPDHAIEWASVQALEGTGRRDLFLDLQQRRALLAELTGGARDLAEAVMLTGARAGELTSATRSRFDARTGCMTFIGKTGKRTVPVSAQAIALFTRLSRDKLPAAALFTRDDGMTWVRRGDWSVLINEAAARAKLPAGTCLYTLRHSFITEAITSGMSPLEVARLVGTSLTMIDKHYGHLAANSARERLAAVNFT